MGDSSSIVTHSLISDTEGRQSQEGGLDHFSDNTAIGPGLTCQPYSPIGLTPGGPKKPVLGTK